MFHLEQSLRQVPDMPGCLRLAWSQLSHSPTGHHNWLGRALGPIFRRVVKKASREGGGPIFTVRLGHGDEGSTGRAKVAQPGAVWLRGTRRRGSGIASACPPDACHVWQGESSRGQREKCREKPREDEQAGGQPSPHVSGAFLVRQKDTLQQDAVEESTNG